MPIKTETHGGALLKGHNYPFPVFAEHLTICSQNLFTVEAIIKKLFSVPRKTKIQSAVAWRFTVKEVPQ